MYKQHYEQLVTVSKSTIVIVDRELISNSSDIDKVYNNLAGRTGGDVSPRYLCLILTTKQAARTLITHKDLSTKQLSLKKI